MKHLNSLPAGANFVKPAESQADWGWPVEALRNDFSRNLGRSNQQDRRA